MKTKLFLALCLAGCMAKAQSPLIYTVAGDGTYGYTGDGGFAMSGELATPVGVFVDTHGNMYIADEDNNAIRKVTSTGIISTIAGDGTQGYSGDGGQATAALLKAPAAVTLDKAGNIYISDWGNHVVRKINTAGVISTYAGNGSFGYSGDGGQATSAELKDPQGLLYDDEGSLLIADEGSNVVRAVNSSTGIISTFAGTGTAGHSNDGGQATAAELNAPWDVTTDMYANIYIADLGNFVIREVTTAGIITVAAGTYSIGGGYSGDGGQATAANLNNPAGVVFDANGNLYISDSGNSRIRKVNTAGVISTFAGNGTASYSGDGGYATNAEIHDPQKIAVDATGNLYIADADNNRIREVSTYCYANAGPNVQDVQTCTSWAQSIGTPSVTNMSYSWTPASGTHYSLNHTNIAQPSVVFTNTVATAPIFTVSVSYSLCTTTTSTVQVTPIALACPGCCRVEGISSFNTTSANFAVYPNPATAQITMSLPNAAEYIRIIDIQGRLVYETKNIETGDFMIDVSLFNKGMYFVMAKIGDAIEKKKLVVE